MSENLSANRTRRREMMLEYPVYKVLPIVAVPMIISMLIDSLYNIADAYFVSQIGQAATAAVGVNDSLAHFIRSVSMGFGVGASSYISRLMGAKREDEASRVGTTTLITGMLLVLLLAALAFVFIEPLIMLLGSTVSTKEYSIDYAQFILAAAPFTAGEVVLGQLLRAEGSTRFSMVGMVSGCVINIILDPIFITVLGLGVAGAAIATSISKVISFGVLLFPFFRRKTLLELRFRFFAPSREIYKEVAKMGIPAFLRSSMLTIATVVTNNVAGAFSDTALAASSLSHRCTRLVASAISGFGQGFQPVVGYCWGAKRYKRVLEAFWTCSIMGAAGVSVLGAIMFVFTPQLIGIFSNGNIEMIAIGTLMIRSQCITMVFHVWIIIVNGLFQALGRAVIAGFLGLSRQLICLVPCVLILSALFGINGLSLAQAVADFLCVVVALPLVVRIVREIKSLAKTE